MAADDDFKDALDEIAAAPIIHGQDEIETKWSMYFINRMLELAPENDFHGWWTRFTRNRNVPGWFILENLDRYPWQLSEIFERPDIPIETIIARFPINKVIGYISSRYDLTIDFVAEHPEYPWNYYFLSQNKTLTIEFIAENLDKGWEWKHILANPALNTNRVLTEFSDIITDETFLRSNGLSASYCFGASIAELKNLHPTIQEMLFKPAFTQNLNVGMVRANPNLKWNWYGFSANPYLPYDFIVEFEDYINWDILTSSICREMIDTHPNLPWVELAFAKRNDTTMEDYKRIIDKYNIIEMVALNGYDYDECAVLFTDNFTISDYVKLSNWARTRKISLVLNAMLLDNSFAYDKKRFMSDFDDSPQFMDTVE